MSDVHVPFPDAWAVVRAGEGGEVDRRRLATTLASLGPDAQAVMETYTEQLGRLLSENGLAALATLVVPGPQPGDEASAWVVLQSIGPVATHESGLLDLVVRNPFPVVADNPDPTIVHGRLGAIAKAVQFRPNPNLSDADGYWPYGASVRYVMPTGPDSVMVAQFETLSLAYLPDLEEHFDTVITHASLV